MFHKIKRLAHLLENLKSTKTLSEVSFCESGQVITMEKVSISPVIPREISIRPDYLPNYPLAT